MTPQHRFHWLLWFFVLPGRISAAELPKGHDDNVYALAVSADGKLSVSASEDNYAILWDTSKNTPRLAFEHTAPVYDAAFGPGAKEVFTAVGDGALSVWDTTTGKRLRKIGQHKGTIYSLAVSADGKLVASGGGEDDPAVRVWDATTGKKLHEYTDHTKPVYGLAFHPKKPILASSSSDTTVRLWQLDGTEHHVLRGHTSHVYRCVFSPDGKWLVTGSHDKTVRVWDSATGKEVSKLKGMKDAVYAVAISADGKQLAAAGEDRVIRRWSLLDSKPLDPQMIPGRKPVYSLIYLPGGKTLLAGCGDFKIHRISE